MILNTGSGSGTGTIPSPARNARSRAGAKTGKWSLRILPCGQPYKHSTIVKYVSRVVITSKLLILTTLEL